MAVKTKPWAEIAAYVTIALTIANSRPTEDCMSSNVTFTLSVPSEVNQPSIAVCHAAEPSYDQAPHVSNTRTFGSYRCMKVATSFA